MSLVSECLNDIHNNWRKYFTLEPTGNRDKSKPQMGIEPMTLCRLDHAYGGSWVRFSSRAWVFQVPVGPIICKICHLNVTIKFSFFQKMASLLIWKRFGKVCQKCIGKDLNMKGGHFSHNKYGLITVSNDIYHNIELCLINLGVIFGVRTCWTPRWYQRK